MGELLFCNEPMAALPYFIEAADINIYSMEELCYYIMGSAYLLDPTFMSEELCTWIEKQMGRVSLSGRLRDIMREGGKLSDFVTAIVGDCAYCTKREQDEILAAICQMEEKSEFERGKIRADQLIEKGKYVNGIYEYKRLLDMGDVDGGGELTVGNIWHNLGTAYARLFLFEEARDCYEKAYKHNLNFESLKEFLLCCLILGDETAFIRTAMERDIDETGMQEIRNEYAMAEGDAPDGDVDALIEDGDPKKITERILEWKEAYRKSCRV
ncbi:MAG: tetratricopeptide repeat protein [Clostridiales bacterium]|nr:tetratricopeptide repeat protein [Clostridiales bacterium]